MTSNHPSLSLEALLEGLDLRAIQPGHGAVAPKSAEAKSMPVAGITSDSRKVQPGWVFVALVGSHTDGHQYLQKAVEAGALAVIIDAHRQARVDVSALAAPVFASPDPYRTFAQLTSRWHGEPGRTMRMIGVTGTNGKTTVTHLVEQMLREAGLRVGLIGTLGVRSRAAGVCDNAAGAETAGYTGTHHTTPMADELAAILAEMRDAGTKTVVMEVSSHALQQHRVAGCDFEVAVFTNLTQDHLDYHKTMGEYAEAKALLFKNLDPSHGPRWAVINRDDPSAERFLAACPPGVQTLTYGLDHPQADVRATDATYDLGGAKFQVVTPQGEAPVHLKIGGRFSVYNALAALATGLALGIPLNTCIQSLEAVPGIRGRFEVVARNPSVIVDYAHTPDGLENVLAAARQVVPTGGRLIGVFGCGGDRDATKRPQMGRIAERLADVLVVTSDNPRSEDPQQILTDILSGIQRFDPTRMIVNVDRREAIHQAIDLAQPQDVIVVAGKGHEDYQILADRTIHFDDREVVQEYVAGRQPTSV